MKLLYTTLILFIISIICLILGMIIKSKKIKTTGFIIVVIIAIFWFGFLIWSIYESDTEYERRFPSENKSLNIKENIIGNEECKYYSYENKGNTNLSKSISKEELAELKTTIENDEANYGDNYQKFTYCPYAYKKEPDRIYFKSSKEEGFYVFEKDDKNYNHVLEVSEDRMHYSSIEDYNLYCFTPDSINTMMTSGDNYIIFDYDNADLAEADSNYNKDLIFRFMENTRLYRLVTYLSYYKELIQRENLNKEEFATNTSISGFKYMMYVE